MTYELAKKLKEAGFPQRGLDDKLHNITPGMEVLAATLEPSIPTLSELIEACGDKFMMLDKKYDGWRAFCDEEPLEAGITFGKTPEEAVANLWLALNPPQHD